jgi:predicted  nucleic acid-binding Zn-ribbon protein
MNKKQEQRMSRVLKLREENEKLEAELKALRERIAAAEERSQNLAQTATDEVGPAQPSM